MPPPVNPATGKTTDWRAGCGRSACPVRREGEPHALPTPIQELSEPAGQGALAHGLIH